MEAVSAGASQPRRIFVTVGSTKFTHLVTAVVSRDVIEAVGRAAAVSGGSSSPEVKITIQYGATPLADILTAEGSALVQQQDAGDAARSDADVAAAAALLVREQQQQQADERVTGERDAEDAPTDALSDTALSKMFRLKARSLYDEDSEDDEHRTAHREAQHIATRPAARRGDSNSRAFTFRIPTTAGNTVALELIDFVDNIRPYLETSEIVISHAGSGTILEALRLTGSPRLSPPKLVVVPNETLMDNHQAELALALARQRYLLATRVVEPGTPTQLPALLAALLAPSSADRSTTTVPFPPPVPGRFRSLVDEQMGFVAGTASGAQSSAGPRSLLLDALSFFVHPFVSTPRSRNVTVDET